MAGISRVNGFGNYVVGSYRSSANIGAYLVTVKNGSNSAVDIRAEDDAANEAVEAIMMATNAIGLKSSQKDILLRLVYYSGMKDEEDYM